MKTDNKKDLSKRTFKNVIQNSNQIIDKDNGRLVADTFTAHYKEFTNEQMEANAAYIVLAVNNFDKLVEALKESNLQLEYIDQKFTRTGTTNSTITRNNILLESINQQK